MGLRYELEKEVVETRKAYLAALEALAEEDLKNPIEPSIFGRVRSFG